jgi:type I restriction enzyme M protein
MAQDLNYKSFIWGIAEKLRGPYRRSDNGKVILPFTVLRRLDCVLERTKDEVLNAAAATKEGNVARDFQLQKIAGYSFYNTSPYDLRKVVGDPANLKQNLQAYVAGFSPNVRDVFDRYAFDTHLENLDEADLLLLVTQEFLKVDLHPGAVDNATMGHIFEHLIAKAMEASNEESGDYFTPRDVVRLMVNLLFARDDEVLSNPGLVRSIYDPTAGTGGMLSVAEEHIRQFNPDAQLTLYGQEFNKESYAIAKTDLLIKGQTAENMVFGDTLTDDGHWDKTFDYGLANPPFGVEWVKQREFVTHEHEQRGFNGRFGAGLPRVSDGSLLFLMHLVSKMRTAKEGGGRIGIVLNGSPLFTGGAGQGESEIRRWVLENDLVEAIVGLPKDMFYNTGIATYIWLLDNDKPQERRGKVQLVDATNKFTKMRKNLGDKRNEISPDNIDEIVKLYDAFEENDESKIFGIQDFGYTTITVEQPLRQNWSVKVDRIDTALDKRTLQKLGPMKLELLRESLHELATLDSATTTDLKQFTARIKQATAQHELNASQLKSLITGLAERDDTAPIQNDAKGNPVPDTDLRDTENVPLGRDIDEYIETEIAPHLGHFWVDRSKDKIGYEIPFTRHFYRFPPSRPLEEIDNDLNHLVKEIGQLLREMEG